MTGTKQRRRGRALRVGVDTGGTFTDLVTLEGGRLAVRKVLSTPQAPEEAVLAAIEAAGLLGWSGRLIHGSTVGLNAILEGRGARVALVTNEGFEDLLEIGRQDRPNLYTTHVPPRPVLVPRALRFGVRERRSAGGARLARAGRRELSELRRRIAGSGAEAVAVCLLHAYAHPEDEERIARELQPLRLPVVCSSALVRRHREVERCSTAVLDAFVRPVLERYWSGLAQRIAPLELHVVRNEGGTLPVREALRAPIRAVLSGPAGGAAGAAFWARAAGFDEAVGFDMGGTSADVALCGGEVQDESEIGPYPLALPTVPVVSVGCGGGSLAWFDEGGALRVGPRSAGADPGPACYGRGNQATLTDAHLVLGRLPAFGLLGGGFPLDRERAVRALRAVARRLGTDPRGAARGMLEVADAQMARLLRRFTLGRGLDPADVCLVAFGGAGGLHAARLARLVGFRAVLVPPAAGLLSAAGMLLMPPVFELEEAFVATLDDAQSLATAARRLRARALEEAAGRFGEARVEVLAALRYRGNLAELWVPAGRDARKRFEEAFRRRFGFVQDLPIEVLRLRARVRFERSVLARLARRLLAAEPEARVVPPGSRPARLAPGGLRFVTRAEVPEDRTLAGPLAVLDHDATTIVERGFTVRRLPGGSLLLEGALKRRGRSGARS